MTQHISVSWCAEMRRLRRRTTVKVQLSVDAHVTVPNDQDLDKLVEDIKHNGLGPEDKIEILRVYIIETFKD